MPKLKIIPTTFFIPLLSMSQAQAASTHNITIDLSHESYHVYADYKYPNATLIYHWNDNHNDGSATNWQFTYGRGNPYIQSYNHNTASYL